MVFEIVNFHSALRAELTYLTEMFISYHDAMLDPQDGDEVTLEEFECLHSDFLSYITVLKSHSGAEDKLIFPVIVARLEEARASLDKFEAEHIQIAVYVREVMREMVKFRESFGESLEERTCIMKKIVALMGRLRASLFAHLHREETVLHPLMHGQMTQSEINLIVGRVLGHRSSELMAAILRMLYRHLPKQDFDICLVNIQKSVSGTYFEKWLSSMPPIPATVSALSSTSDSDSDEPAESEMEKGYHTDELDTHVAVARMIAGETILKKDRIATIAKLRKEVSEPPIIVLDDLLQTDVSLGNRFVRRKRKHSEIGKLSFNFESSRDLAIESVENGQTDTRTEEVAVSMPKPPLPAEDYEKSFADSDKLVLGCSHYRRKCKIVAPCCNRAFCCRFCHDDVYGDNHIMDRFSVKNIVCMECGTEQEVARTCCVPACSTVFGSYFCHICNFFDDSGSPVYHCPYCNICRKGTGLGLDSEFYHCMTCNACVRKDNEEEHKCLSNSIERTCPICQSYLFDSVEKLKGLRCGHVMHLTCYMQYRGKANICPCCRASIDEGK